MDPITEILGRPLADFDAEALTARLAELEPDQLVALNEALLTAFDTADGEARSTESVARMASLRGTILAVRGENERREQAQAELEAQAEAIRTEVAGETDPAPADPAADPAAAADPSGDPPADPAAPADPEAAADPATPADPAVDLAPADPAAAEPIAAAATPPRPVRPPASALSRYRPAHHAPRPATDETEPFVITAAGDVEGFSAGQRLTMDDVLSGIVAKERATRGVANGKFTVATLRHSDRYPEERRLRAGHDQENMRRIDVVTAALQRDGESLTAAGGLCAPVAPDYSQAMISTADRPVRDSLPQFGATRGGIRFIRPATLADVGGAVGIWTEADDANPGNATKNILTITCGDEVEVVVDAVTRRLQVGNFMARTFEERVQEFSDLTMAAWARLAEDDLLSAMDTASDAVTAGQLLGFTRNLLPTIDRCIAAYRWRHRTAREMPLRIVVPEYVDDIVRADLAREMPGATAERLATVDTEIDRFFAARNVSITRHLDDVAAIGSVWALQGAGELNPWPDDFVLRIGHEGAFQFLDGGTLDLGIVRDSTLNAQNNLQTFAESFEALAFRGVEAQTITIEGVCANGQAAELADSTAECLSGS